MRRFFRVAGWLVAVVIVSAACVLLVGTQRLAKGIDVPVHAAPAAATTPERIEEGRHLAITLGCTHCHGDQLQGTDFVKAGPFMMLPAPNLSGGRVTAAVIERAVRHGVGSDGRSLLVMPIVAFAAATDEDIASLSGFILGLPAVETQLMERSVGPIGRAVAAFQAPTLQPGKLIEQTTTHPGGFGNAISRYTPFCAECHGNDFGGKVFSAEVDYWAPNLTNHSTGAGSWTRDQFADAIQRGRTPDGRTLAPDEMPWKSMASLTDAEVDSIYAFLRSQPPIDRPRPAK